MPENGQLGTPRLAKRRTKDCPGVELGEAETGFQVSRSRRESGRHHPTGTTPGRLEIRGRREVSTRPEEVESNRREYEGTAFEQRFAQYLRRDSYTGCAVDRLSLVWQWIPTVCKACEHDVIIQYQSPLQW